ncbi:MAG: hypothetical protein RL122_2426 [Pseudomonadota bacterium]|jgi:TPR repeat protein
MTIATAPSRTLSLFVSPALLLSFLCAFAPNLTVANPVVAPAAPVNINEAPPPWQVANAKNAQVDQQPTATTASGSSVENWYRNRRKAAGSTDNELATLKATAGNGDIKAQYKLALMYRNDDSTPANITQSLDWQQKAAQAGHVEAQYGLGLLYANGQYVTASESQARAWFQKAADQGHVAARLALLSMNNGASAQAVATAPAIEEAPKADISVVDTSSYPPPVATKVALSMPADAPDAAFDNTNSDGDNAAASLDLTGIEPAVLRQSAEDGDKQAQLMLGTMYEDGLGGLPADLREAAYWYEQAAKQNYPKAQYNLGLLYEDGRGVNQNYNQAAYWYDQAAKAGFTEAQNNLGVLYVLGNGVKKDGKKAAKLFTDAASRGNADAKRNLEMLNKG